MLRLQGGREYTWGFGKNHYRHEPLNFKRKKYTFWKLIQDCLSREKFTPELIRSFSKRARDYIISYHLLTVNKSELTERVTKDMKEDDPLVVKVEN